MGKLSRRGQAGVENRLPLSCSAVFLIEYKVAIKAQPLIKIPPLLLTSWLTDETHGLFLLRYEKPERERKYRHKNLF